MNKKLITNTTVMLVTLILLFGCDNKNSEKGESKEENLEKTLEKRPKTNTPKCPFFGKTITIGKGIALPKKEKLSFEIELFNDPSLQDTFFHTTYNSRSNEVPFCAKYHNQEYGVLRFIVTEILENSYEVIINYDEKKYIHKKGDFEFVDWGEYIKQSLALRPLDKKNPPLLFTEPKSSSELIDLPDQKFTSYCFLDIQNEWVKVQYNCLINSVEIEDFSCNSVLQNCKTDPIIGWLQWKNADQLLIEIPTGI